MLFHTWIFFIFFLIVYPVYLAIKDTRLAAPWLLLASYVFYAWWNPLYLILIVYSTLLDFWVVQRMEKSERKKLWLLFSVVNNLFLLGFFKYGGFVAENLNWLLEACSLGYRLPAPDVLLPVGISFYTFQSMSYTIDYYRGLIPREPSFIRFSTFVTFFPQLVAGPIERAKSLLPQFTVTPKIHKQDIADGLSLFIVGLFKKLAMADYLAMYVDPIYAVPGNHSGLTLFLATFAFGWQIYFDFSGYTDMARGIGRMMGYRLMLNFNNPYLATGLGDFWNRWHISLSTWFKDYVYIPLGGNRNGTAAMYRNVLLTMVISGLWHGAGWTFVIWGALHALGRVFTLRLERSPYYRDRVPKFLKQLFIFLFVTFTWIFFRATSLDDALLITGRIFTGSVADPRFPLAALAMIAALWTYAFLYESPYRFLIQNRPVKVFLVILMVLYIAVAAPSGEQAFIYFQF
ncbi:MAG TPA: MBOAT family O-acyltransferase [bacterium]|nr:MBOAT family O-acyltransferase [bacterium]HQO33497.1 MBOAT family O-acyltransferase [bacterium]